MNDFQKLLKNYQRKLTNLSGSNKSLVQLRLSVSQDIDLDAFDFLTDGASFSIIQQLIEGKRSIVLCKELDPRNTKTNDASKRLKKILRKDNFLFEERGVKDLYIGWPYVQGKFSNGSPVRCPLLYFPVEIALTTGEWRLKLRKEVDISFNKTFLLAYSLFNEVKLKEELLEFSFDDFGKDITLFRNKLYDLLKGSPLEINFNQDLFGNRLEKFIDYRKDDFTKSYENGIIKLQPYAVLGIAPQSGSNLIPDYEELLEKSTYENLEALFYDKTFTKEEAQSNFSYNYLAKIKEEHTITPLAIDGSQENALKAIKEGHSLVVQGPPGTGKSQLICNIASDYIARGKRVLVVCQKRVALDVVYNRLKEIELAPFTALVHDFKSDRASLYNQINEQIESLNDYQSLNNGFDAIHLEREFSQTSRQIDQHLEQLESFREALFNDLEYGISIKELYLNSDRDNAKIDLTHQYRDFPFEKEQLFEKLLGRIITYQDKFTQSHPWSDRVDFSSFDLTDQINISNAVKELPEKVTAFENGLKALFGHLLPYKEALWLYNKKETLHTLVDLMSQPNIFKKFQLKLKHRPDKEWLLMQEQQIDELYRDIGIETSIPQEELGNFLAVLQEGIEARKSPLKKAWWTLFNKNKYYIKRVMVENDLPWDNKGFKRIVQRVDNRLNLEHKLSLFNDIPWLTDVPDHPSKETIFHWIHDNFQAIECVEILKDIKQHCNLFGFKELPLEKVLLRIKTFQSTTAQFETSYNNWLKKLTATQIDRLLDEEDYTQHAITTIKDEFDDLCRFDQLKATLSAPQKDVILKLNELKEVSSLQKTKVFKDSNRLVWINHLEKKYPVLKIVSTEEIHHIEEDLEFLIKKKSTISKDILLLKAREQTYQNLEFNRLKNRITYRELQHQVTKKRRIWALRKLLSEFYDDVFNLIPCWLASPEAVSSIFPLEKMFDLVIFDEASQCFSEKSLPALERGRQIVISGDAQQLSPNDLYQVRWDEDENELIEFEKDSLLDLASQYLPQVMLQGHYRSQYLELIDFSNRHFYKNKLQMLPYATDVDSHVPPINYVYLADGLWENSCNLIEARKVIQTVQKLIEEGQKSIGIVTFNYKQQNLIEDLLDEFAQDYQVALPIDLFVKNIENVQGDEREHIIFSIGYAKNTKGRLVMNFGTLNQENGEKRLNVAITRAKKSITIIASILPNELNVDESKHLGPRLFKEYLAYGLDVSNGKFSFEEKTIVQENEQLLKTIIQTNLKEELTVTQTQFADIRIDNKLFLTDDDNYFNAISCKEAHITKPLLLEDRGWKARRIYSRNFWLNQAKFYVTLKR